MVFSEGTWLFQVGGVCSHPSLSPWSKGQCLPSSPRRNFHTAVLGVTYEDEPPPPNPYHLPCSVHPLIDSDSRVSGDADVALLVLLAVHAEVGEHLSALAVQQTLLPLPDARQTPRRVRLVLTLRLLQGEQGKWALEHPGEKSQTLLIISEQQKRKKGSSAMVTMLFAQCRML